MICFVLVLMTTLPACRRAREEEPVPPDASWPPSIIARVHGTNIDVEDLGKEAERRGLDRSSAEDLSMLLDERIRFELVLAEAQRTGFDQTPELREKWRRFIVGHFLEQQERAAGANPDEARMRAWYETHRDRFVTPGRAQVALLSVKVPTKADDQRRAEARARIDEIRAAAEAVAKASRDFGSLAREFSDHQPTRYQGGDLGWLTAEQAKSDWGPELADAMFGLSLAGEISPVIENAGGFHLVKLIDKQEARVASFEEVRESVVLQLQAEERSRSRDTFYADLRARFPVEINHALLPAGPPPAGSGKPDTPPPMPGR